MSVPKIMSGSRAILKINGKIIAYAVNVSYRIALQHAPVNVLGRYSAARYEALGYDCTVDMSVLRFSAEGGKGNAEDGQLAIRPKLQDLMTSEDLTIEILDRKTNESILVVHKCRAIDAGGNIGARALMSESWSFVGCIAESSDSGPQQESTGANTQAAE